MMVWFVTIVLGCIVAIIIYTSVRDGQRTTDFLEAITPEINRFRDHQIEKYKEKFGRAPTGTLLLVIYS